MSPGVRFALAGSDLTGARGEPDMQIELTLQLSSLTLFDAVFGRQSPLGDIEEDPEELACASTLSCCRMVKSRLALVCVCFLQSLGPPTARG